MGFDWYVFSWIVNDFNMMLYHTFSVISIFFHGSFFFGDEYPFFFC